MSFGDISPVLPPQPQSLAPPAISELQRLLKPLAANNAALRQATTRLHSKSPQTSLHLKRIRALREQNRQIARAAATISTSVDFQVAGHQPHVLARANQAKSEFQTLLDDFSNALTDSLDAERSYVHTLASPQSHQLSQTQVAIEQENTPFKAPSENDPLLPHSPVRTQREAAALREVHTNNALVEERRAVLADVQSSIDDVNAIFKDLSLMISDQGAQVEHVEIAVSETTHNVAAARRELEKTQARREARKRFFFVTLLSIAFIIALFLIFLLS